MLRSPEGVGQPWRLHTLSFEVIGLVWASFSVMWPWRRHKILPEQLVPCMLDLERSRKLRRSSSSFYSVFRLV